MDVWKLSCTCIFFVIYYVFILAWIKKVVNSFSFFYAETYVLILTGGFFIMFLILRA